jgi:hypothetical protein
MFVKEKQIWQHDAIIGISQICTKVGFQEIVFVGGCCAARLGGGAKQRVLGNSDGKILR